MESALTPAKGKKEPAAPAWHRLLRLAEAGLVPRAAECLAVPGAPRLAEQAARVLLACYKVSCRRVRLVRSEARGVST